MQNATATVQKDASTYLASNIFLADKEKNKEVQQAYYSLNGPKNSEHQNFDATWDNT